MHSHVSRAAATRAAQGFLDRLTPPEDPPEIPDMYWQEKELLFGQDTDLVTFQDFRRSADDHLADMGPDGFLIDLVLAACRSDDMIMRSLTKSVRKKLGEHASQMIESAFMELIKEDDEP